MKIAAEHTLVVGDMGVDILMGARACCKTVGVTYGRSTSGRLQGKNGTREELVKSGADFIIDDMAELIKEQ
jgi:phosphoglycolate phosphatase